MVIGLIPVAELARKRLEYKVPATNTGYADPHLIITGSFLQKINHHRRIAGISFQARTGRCYRSGVHIPDCPQEK